MRDEQPTADILVLRNRGAMDRTRLLSTSKDEMGIVFSALPSSRMWIDPQLAAVYVVGNSANPLLKIGHADNLKHRFAGLNVGSPVDLQLLHFVFFVGRLVAKSVERQVHDALAAHRSRGEWFNVDLATASSAIAKVTTDRRLAWWTEAERRSLGTAAIRKYDSDRFHGKNFFLRN